MTPSRIRKAVIPAAGFGSRFLPATKTLPKEMLTIVDKPVIQYVVEEAVAAGITDILLVISRGKRAIEEHFGRNPELEALLAAKGRQADLDRLAQLGSMARIHYTWQADMRGLGDAVACGAAFAGDEPFAVLLGDTVTRAPEPVMAQLVRLFDRHACTVLGVEPVAPARVGAFGVIAGTEIEPGVYRVADFVEKPDPAAAPSNLVIAGRYIFTPEIFEHIRQTPPGKGNEVQLTDAMRRQLAGAPAYALRYRGERHDVGNPLDFLRSNLLFTLDRPDLAPELKSFLDSIGHAWR